MKKYWLRAAFISTVLSIPSNALATYPTHDAATNANLSSIGASVVTVLVQIGQAVNATGNKIANTLEASARTEREFMAAQEQNRRFEDARQRYVVPSSLCSESVTIGMAKTEATTAAIKASLRNGDGITYSTPAIKEALTAVKSSVQDDAILVQQAHAIFCDKDDFAAYGGSTACPEISTEMPGADKRIDTLTTGAGRDGKSPDLTFTQKQAEVAALYIKNGYRPTIAPKLSKEQANKEQGAEYIGVMTSYDAAVSTAEAPAMNRLASSLPNPDTANALAEARKTPSSEYYYQQYASVEAKKSGQMSMREFEWFDVNRRYANKEYAADLQDMVGDNLLREQIRVQVQTNALLLRIKDELELGNIISGQLLAGHARVEYTPKLQQLYHATNHNEGK